MVRLRLLPILILTAACVASACGEGSGKPHAPGGLGPSTGGIGGAVEGVGGAGGVGGDDGGGGGRGSPSALPEVDGFEPDHAGPGFSIRVYGRNFGRDAPNNSVYFASGEGDEVPTLESVGVRAAADGSYFEVLVPKNAHSGPTRVAVSTSEGRSILQGPVFTVTDATLPPVVDSVGPTTVSQNAEGAELEIRGKGFYPERTTVRAGETSLPVDWSRSDEEKLVVPLPAPFLAEPATHALWVENPEPGGGRAGPFELRVVQQLRLLSVEAVTPLSLALTFDRRVLQSAALNRSNFVIEGFPNAIRQSWPRPHDASVIDLALRDPLPGPETYTLGLSRNLVSSEGGQLAEDRVNFVSYDPSRELLAEIGVESCGAEGFADPTGITLAGEKLYVVERKGNQVQVLDAEGAFLGFYGHDGRFLGYHEGGSATGCAEGIPGTEGLGHPLGRVVVTEAGEVLVGDSENGRVLAFGEGESRVLVADLPL